jgi:hypothetical protein
MVTVPYNLIVWYSNTQELTNVDCYFHVFNSMQWGYTSIYKASTSATQYV